MQVLLALLNVAYSVQEEAAFALAEAAILDPGVKRALGELGGITDLREILETPQFRCVMVCMSGGGTAHCRWCFEHSCVVLVVVVGRGGERRDDMCLHVSRSRREDSELKIDV